MQAYNHLEISNSFILTPQAVSTIIPLEASHILMGCKVTGHMILSSVRWTSMSGSPGPTIPQANANMNNDYSSSMFQISKMF